MGDILFENKLKLVHLFPITAVKSTTDLGGLKQQVILQFWQLKVPNHGVGRSVFPPEPLVEESIPCFFQLLVAAFLSLWLQHSTSVSMFTWLLCVSNLPLTFLMRLSVHLDNAGQSF